MVRTLCTVFILTLLLGLPIACGDRQSGTDRGEQLARTYCSGCHRFPEPDRLSRRIWHQEVLPLMGAFLGVPGSMVLDPSITDNYPDRPVLSSEEWKAIQQWYLTQAPDTLLSPAGEREEITVGLKHFTTHLPEERYHPPMTTLVRIDTARRRIVFADLKENDHHLSFLAADGRLLSRSEIGRPVSDIAFVADSIYLTALGDLRASDEAWGALELLSVGAEARATIVIEHLQRPVQSLRHDVDGDGRLDWIIAEFGKYSGQLSWFGERDGQWVRHPIVPRPGAVHMELTDFDGDGRQDLMVAFGQGDERISVFLQEGQGFLRERRLIEFPPSHGTVGFQLADFDGDGLQDILYTNGDNADYPRPDLKPYHGYTIYLRETGDTFRQAYRFPIHGAYGARVADFDLDGDLDFATVAFYPDFSREPRESFIYFECTSGVGEELTFVPFTLTEFREGRFMVIDSGDVDGDGDEDIVLGSYVDFPVDNDRHDLQQRWLAGGASVVLLENTTH